MSETDGLDHRGGMLGTLRSELDDSDTGLDQAFETMLSLAGSVRTAFLGFRINPRQAALIFQDLRLRGSDGNEWTVGPTSSTWYRRQLGEPTWRKSPMPLGVTPVDRPDWLTSGIAARLQAAEKEAREELEAFNKRESETVVEDASVDPFSTGAINPFLRKDIGDATSPGATPSAAAPFATSPPASTPGVPRTLAGGDDDVDWIFEEWEAFDRKVEEVRSSQRPALPTELPQDLDPDRQLGDALADPAPPRDRQGSNTPGSGPVDRRPVSPEEFFLSDDD